MHSPIPARDAYQPLSQPTHPVLPYPAATAPAGHSAHAVLPAASEYEPGLHCWHVALLVAPSVVEYVPAEQLVHAVRPGAAEYVPLGQGRHVCSLSAPVASEYLPAGHDTQSRLLPLATLKEPGGQGWQDSYVPYIFHSDSAMEEAYNDMRPRTCKAKNLVTKVFWEREKYAFSDVQALMKP